MSGVATSFTSATPTAVPTRARDVEGAMIKMRWRWLGKEVDSPKNRRSVDDNDPTIVGRRSMGYGIAGS